MVKYLTSTFIFLTLVSCSSGPRQTAPVAYNSGIALENMLIEQSPGEDFHRYVNGHWQDYGIVPENQHQYDVYDEIDQRAHEAVLQIIKRAARTRYGNGTDEQKVGDLYQSFLDFERRDNLGVTPIQPIFDRINSIESRADFAKYLAYATKYNYNPPFDLRFEVDLEDTSKYMVTTWQAGLGLPNKEHYLSTEQKYRDLRSAYREHIMRMFELAGIADAELAARKVVSLETELAGHQEDKADDRNIDLLYNKFLYHNLPQIMPYFDWKEYMADAGIFNTDGLVVPQINYLRGLNEMLVTTELEDWKLYFTWHALHANATYLTRNIERQHFAFYGKQLRQQKGMKRAEWRAVDAVNDVLGDIVGKNYVAEQMTRQKQQRVSQMSTNQIRALTNQLEDIEWLYESTQENALEKLEGLKVLVGGPTTWRDYSNLEIKFGDYFGNRQRAALFDYQLRRMRLTQAVSANQWPILPQSTRITYQPEGNKIFIPAGSIQPPLFDSNAEDAINYGAFGTVLADTLIASIDREGRNFNRKGVYAPWWHGRDKREYRILTARLGDQYDLLAINEEDDAAIHAWVLQERQRQQLIAEQNAIAASEDNTLIEEVPQAEPAPPETETAPQEPENESDGNIETMPAVAPENLPANDELPASKSTEEISTDVASIQPDGGETDQQATELEDQNIETVEDSSIEVPQSMAMPALPMVNGRKTVYKAIRDVNALQVSLDAYQFSSGSKSAATADGFTGIQRFFIGYGQRWRVLYTEERLQELQQQDNYLPVRHRVNGAVRNIDEFYQAFDVNENDRIYLPEELRVKVW
ncbi:M13-type metalloendopeptidase [Thalassotalea sp. PS06]|uniref:M13-type metalloendopeptidase n=1 Tax=Thalassotalea sp. PS06 TaxID=2594005 RepID=UPI00163D7A5C|nr:M13 family metallopeptidase [Thalassotalea sp. PS06]